MGSFFGQEGGSSQSVFKCLSVGLGNGRPNGSGWLVSTYFLSRSQEIVRMIGWK